MCACSSQVKMISCIKIKFLSLGHGIASQNSKPVIYDIIICFHFYDVLLL